MYLYDKSPFATADIPPNSIVTAVYQETEKFKLPDNAIDVEILNGSGCFWDAAETGSIILVGNINFGVLFYDAKDVLIGGTVLGTLAAVHAPMGSIGYTAVQQKHSYWILKDLINLSGTPDPLSKAVPGKIAKLSFFQEGDILNIGKLPHKVSLTLDASWEINIEAAEDDHRKEE